MLLLWLFFVSMMSEIEAGWKNRWDHLLNFQCSSERSAIYQVVSTHHGYYEEWRFDFNCRQVLSVSGPVSRSWSGIEANYVIYFVFVLCKSRCSSFLSAGASFNILTPQNIFQIISLTVIQFFDQIK